MTLPKVLAFGHRFGSLAIEREVLADVAQVVDGNSLSQQEQAICLAEVSAVMLGTRAELTTATIERMGHCQVIVRYGVGVDNIDVATASRRGIAVANVPDYCVEEVSDHALALLLAANRRLTATAAAAQAGEWGTGMMKGTKRLALQTVGVMGFGRIARALVRKVRPLVARVIAHDPWLPDGVFAAEQVTPVDFTSLLQQSDYLSIHSPLTTETFHLFNEKTLAQLKPTAWLINTARGEIIDEAALAAALQQGLLGGAALDVLSDEPPAGDHPLFGRSNVVLTPHVAFFSEEAIAALQRGAAEQVREVLLGQSPRWLLNGADLLTTA